MDEAIEKYKKAVSLAPNKSWTHKSHGNAYLLKGMYDEAIAEFNMALTINPDSEYAKEKLEEINEKRINSYGNDSYVLKIFFNHNKIFYKGE
ncbi:tetratricopeptide repeat protein [Candidatus Cloacimonadota bacterium]